jgi:C4-dicarboxylate transporter
MLYTIIAILFIMWLIGFAMSWGGPLIHLLLVLAVVIFLFNILTGRRTAL